MERTTGLSTRSLMPAKLLVGLAVVGLALAGAACSNDPASPGVASLGTGAHASGSGGAGSSSTGSPTSAANLLKFAECMRSHGVINFPDPDSNGQFDITAGNGLNPKSSQWNNAMKACRKYNPSSGPPSPAQQAAMEAQALRYSECMRAHGVHDFPDPQVSHSGGGFGIRISLGGGPGGSLDPQSPVYQHAQQACRSEMPGLKQRGGIIVHGGGPNGAQTHSLSGGSGQVTK